MNWWACAGIAVAVLLAGCTGPSGTAVSEVVIVSGVDTVDEPPAPRATGKGYGHIAGVVVDETVRPVEGARVRVQSLDLVAVTDRTGAFAIADLPPGAYLVKFNATGHQDAQAVVEVQADQFTRTKAILHRILPPDPSVDVRHFRGYVDFTGGPVLFFGESFDLTVDLPGLEAVVVEAVMDPYVGAVAGENGFDIRLSSRSCCATYHRSDMTNPLWTEADGELIKGEELRVIVYPWSQPVAESSKDYDVFVSLFYYQGVPPGYSVVAGNG